MAIEVEVVSRSDAARKDIAQLETSVKGIKTQAQDVTKAFKDMAIQVTASIASVGAVLGVIKFSDEMKGLSSSLKTTTRSNTEFNQALRDTRKIAVETSAALEDVTTLYARISASAEELNATQSEVATVVGNVTRALATGNASVNQTSAAVTQLAQALGSGRLQGDELRSILENSQPLARMIADGLGVSIAQMRKLGTDGALTSELVFGAILGQTEQINEKFGMVDKTISKTATKMGIAAKVFTASFKDAFSALSVEGSDGGILKALDEMSIAVVKFSSQMELKFVAAQYALFKFQLAAKGYLREFSESLEKNLGISVVGIVGLFEGLPTRIAGTFNKIKDFFGSVMSNIHFTPIDVKKFIPNMGEMADFVWSWAKKVERAFFWVYDQVIGHSWIPDLVEGVDSWMQKLNEGPLASVKSFAKVVSSIFEKLANKVLDVPFVQTLIKQLTNAVTAIGSLKVSRDIKQMLGMKERIPGAYDDRNSVTGKSKYDTEAFVGRGPQRNKENRTFMHDIVNSFSSQNQIPLITTIANTFGAGILTAIGTGSVVKGIAAMFGVGIASGIAGSFSSFGPIGIMLAGSLVAAFTGGPVTKAATLLLTGALATGIATTVDRREIAKTADDTIGTLWSGLNKAIQMLFGSGIFGDKGFGMFLLTAAKIALLFKGGREMIGAGLKATATFPTSAINAATTKSDMWVVTKQLERNAKELTKFSPAGIAEKMAPAFADASNAITRLANSKDAKGYTVGSIRAEQITQRLQNTSYKEAFTSLSGLSTEAKQLAMTSRTAAINVRDLHKTYAEAGPITSRLKSSQEGLQAVYRTLESRRQEMGDAIRRGATNFAVGTGGALGGAAGFMLGAELIKGMEGAPEWQKIGVQIAAGMGGQTIGAAIGAGIIFTLRMGIALTSAPLMAAIVGAAVIAGGLWTGALNDAADIFRKLFNSLTDKMAEIVDRLLGYQEQTTSRSRVRAIDDEADRVNKALAKGELSPTEANAQLKKLAEEQAKLLKGIDGFFWKLPYVVKDAINPNSMRAESAIDASTKSKIIATLPSLGLPKLLIESIASKISGVDLSGTSNKTDKVLSELPSNIAEGILNVLVGNAGATQGNPRFAYGKIRRGEDETTNYGNEGRGLTQPAEKLDASVTELIGVIKALEGSGANATSHKGAAGSMQLIESTFKNVVRDFSLPGKDFSNETHRVAAATTHIKDLFDRYKDPEKVFKVYNGGPGALTGNRLTWDKTHTRILDSTDAYASRGMSKLRKLQGSAISSTSAEPMEVSAFFGEIKKINFGEKRSQLQGMLDGILGSLPDSVSKMVSPVIAAMGNIFGSSNDEGLVAQAYKVTTASEDASRALGDLTSIIVEAAKESTSIDFASLSLSELSGYDKTYFETANKALQDFNINPLDKRDITADALDSEEAILAGLEALIGYKKVMDDLTQSVSTQRKALSGYIVAHRAVTKEVEKLRSKERKSNKDEPSDIAEAEGQAYSKSLSQSLQKGLLEPLRNPDFNGSDYLNSIAKQFSDAVLNGLVRGLVDNMLETSGIQALVADTIKGTSGLGEKMGRGIGGYFKKDAPTDEAVQGVAKETSWLTRTWESLKSGFGDTITFLGEGLYSTFDKLFGEEGTISKLLSKIPDLLSSMSGSTGGAVSSAFSAIKGWFGYAEGGAIKGPGTGTSDSIPAMLSNGEFVINAKSAAKFKPLLEQINGGKRLGFSAGGLAYFAEGGSVGVTAGATGSIAEVTASPIVGAIGSLNESISGISSSNVSLGDSVSTFANITKDYSISSGKIIGTGFSAVSDGLVNMGMQVNAGFGAIGLAMAPKAQKFDWIGLALSVASVGVASYGAFSSPSGTGTFNGLKTPSSGGIVLNKADGGFISGPGTGTSDSIPAMLSNGEFIVNALNTKEYLPLLQAINAGRVAHFATGGVVGNVNSIPVGSSTSNANSQQVFNINVTGDISRQTRREIAQMMPDIASGVNMHNKERGNR